MITLFYQYFNSSIFFVTYLLECPQLVLFALERPDTEIKDIYVSMYVKLCLPFLNQCLLLEARVVSVLLCLRGTCTCMTLFLD